MKIQVLSKILIVSALLLPMTSLATASEIIVIPYNTKSPELQGYLCLPKKPGPSPAVIFNHGGVGHIVRGSPKQICLLVAQAGYIGFAPIRRKNRQMHGHLQDVMEAFRFVKNLDKVNPERIAMIGFSRGGLLTLMAGRKTSKLRALVLMAPAKGRGHLSDELEHAHQITMPVLLMVASNDTGSRRTMGQNLVDASKTIDTALQNAGANSSLIIYPAFERRENHEIIRSGHTLFFQPGPYWRDILVFLGKYL